MKKFFFILIILITCNIKAQTALKNSGNMQIHDGGEMGFHTNLINNGTFNQNLGLAGFYNTNQPLNISGTNTPRFFNFEVAVDNDLILAVNTEISNNLSFITGHVVTPRNTPNISLDFVNEAFKVLEYNTRHTDGYTSFTGNSSFEFPIGDDNKLRPLITPSQIIFKANANIESSDIDTDNGTGNNDRGIENSFGTINGFARLNLDNTITQQSIYCGGHGNSINDISRYASSSNCIGIRYGDQNGFRLGKIEASLTSFDSNGFSLNVVYTNGEITAKATTA